MNKLNDRKACLSKRETEVLRAISYGQTVFEIAKEIYLSHHTIVSHKKNLMQKLHAKNIAHLVRIAFEEKLLN